nr:hypothetical protein [Candidatus Phytoplasma sacchari]KAB8121831.1 hypothetical protein F2B49_02080 [Candidatus Phytoplasma sacchari]
MIWKMNLSHEELVKKQKEQERKQFLKSFEIGYYNPDWLLEFIKEYQEKKQQEVKDHEKKK